MERVEPGCNLLGAQMQMEHCYNLLGVQMWVVLDRSLTVQMQAVL